MNKLLAETLSFLNGFLALLTIVLVGVIGMYLGPPGIRFYAQLNGLVYSGSESQAQVLGLVCGVVVGFCIAVVYHTVWLIAMKFIWCHKNR